MTFWGVFLGFLLAILAIAIAIALMVYFANKSMAKCASRHGDFNDFQSRADEVFLDSPVRSYVRLEIPTYPIEAYIRLAGKRKTGEQSYRMEIRLYRSQEKMASEIVDFLDGHLIEVNRKDGGRGFIKLVSVMTSDYTDFLDVLRDLADTFGNSYQSHNLGIQWLIASSSIKSGGK